MSPTASSSSSTTTPAAAAALTTLLMTMMMMLMMVQWLVIDHLFNSSGMWCGCHLVATRLHHVHCRRSHVAVHVRSNFAEFAVLSLLVTKRTLLTLLPSEDVLKWRSIGREIETLHVSIVAYRASPFDTLRIVISAIHEYSRDIFYTIKHDSCEEHSCCFFSPSFLRVKILVIMTIYRTYYFSVYEIVGNFSRRIIFSSNLGRNI